MRKNWEIMAFNFFQKHYTKNNSYPSFKKEHFAPLDIKAWWWRLTTKTINKSFR